VKETGQIIHVDSLRITNSYKDDLKLFIEPWGEELLIPPNLTYAIIAEGPFGDCLELEFGDRTIIVYGWPGSAVSVFDGSKRLCDCRVPAPSTPTSSERD
jgi:hypothetical protein